MFVLYSNWIPIELQKQHVACLSGLILLVGSLIGVTNVGLSLINILKWDLVDKDNWLSF